jgi:outer membrane protein
MKKFIVAGVMALGIFNASAQQKIGYINTDELIGVMPEATKANERLADFQKSLAQQGQDMMADFTAKDSAFSKDSAKWTPTLREIKRKELIELYQKVSGWQQQGQEMYQAEAQKEIAPLKTKAFDAIKEVAKENGYTYILDQSAVLVGPPGDDVLALVKKKLGAVTPPKATTPVKKP